MYFCRSYRRQLPRFPHDICQRLHALNNTKLLPKNLHFCKKNYFRETNLLASPNYILNYQKFVIYSKNCSGHKLQLKSFTYLSINIPPIIGPGIFPNNRIIKKLRPIACDRSSGGTKRYNAVFIRSKFLFYIISGNPPQRVRFFAHNFTLKLCFPNEFHIS